MQRLSGRVPGGGDEEHGETVPERTEEEDRETERVQEGQGDREKGHEGQGDREGTGRTGRQREGAGRTGRQRGGRKDRGTTLHRVCRVWLKAGEMENLWQGPAEQNRAGCWAETTGRTRKQKNGQEAMTR